MLKKYGLAYGPVLECLSSMPGFIPSTHARTHPHTERVGERWGALKIPTNHYILCELKVSQLITLSCLLN